MRKRPCEEQLSFIPRWPLLAMRPRIISVAEVVGGGVWRESSGRGRGTQQTQGRSTGCCSLGSLMAEQADNTFTWKTLGCGGGSPRRHMGKFWAGNRHVRNGDLPSVIGRGLGHNGTAF